MRPAWLLLFSLISFNLFAQPPLRLTDVNPGEGHSYPEIWFEFNNRLYFEAVYTNTGSPSLYSFDGYLTDSLYLMDVGITPHYIRPYHCAILENKAVFWAISSDSEKGLYSVDKMNNVVLEEPHYGDYSMSDFGAMVATNDYVFYSSRDENDSKSYKAFDGNQIQTLWTPYFTTYSICVFRDTVYFFACPESGDKINLYRYDGQNISAVTPDGITKQGLASVSEIYSGTEHIYVMGNDEEDPSYREYVFVLKNDSLQKLPVPEFPDGYMAEVSGIVGDSVFVGINNQATVLYTPDEGRVLSQAISAQDSYSNTPFVKIGNEIVFSARQGDAYGTELFAYNVIDDTIYLLNDYAPGYNSGEPRELTESVGVVYFSVTTSGQRMLGTYDGMNFINYDANPDPTWGSNPTNFYAGSNRIFFEQYDGPGGFGYEVYSMYCENTFPPVDISTCQAFYISHSGIIWTESGVYTDTIKSISACDSIVTINLMLNVDIDITVIQTDSSLTALETPATYQWLNCNNNYSPVPGENSRTFYPKSNGSYGVEITQGDCTDTSDCYLVTPGGIMENTPDPWLVAYPNPTGGEITVSFENYTEDVALIVKDLQGQVLSSTTYKNCNVLNYRIKWPAGVYLLEFRTPEGKKAIIKVFKK
jgi:hypothetical protein